MLFCIFLLNRKQHFRYWLYLCKYGYFTITIKDEITSKNVTFFCVFSVSTVAFSVSHYTAVNSGHVVFSTILLNEGQGYRTSDGYFKAPSSGIYSFTGQLCAKNSQEVIIRIKVYHAGSWSIVASVAENDQEHYVCPQIQALARLSKGDYAYLYSGHSMSDLFQNSFMECYFTGVKISE